MKERAGIEATLAELAPAPPVALLDAGEMLSSFGTIWKGATDVERKQLLQATIDVAYVKEGDLYAVTPRPEYYELLSLSIDSSCGPDGHPARMSNQKLKLSFAAPGWPTHLRVLLRQGQ